MVSEANTGGYYSDSTAVSASNGHTTSFQSGVVNSTSEIMHVGDYFRMNNDAAYGMNFSGNSNTFSNSGMSRSSSVGSHLLEYGSELKNNTAFAAEWSLEEQITLEEGLVNFAAEPSIMKYIKIAALLPSKNVRDVAMKCRWMTRKRRKQVEQNAGSEVTNKKDEPVKSTSQTSLILDPPMNVSAYSFPMHNMDQNKCISFEALSCTARLLIEHNYLVFNQITANLSTLKLQDIIDLFSCSRSNITAILNDMRDMPGLMSQMPPLPVTINEDLANSLMFNTPKSLIFGSPRSFQLKQEPRC